ncbi:hypothetical protein [Sphingobacterium sp.]|uniref:hypothetical protein n=1 Tax=Sphingobacterium sp. TaxID=341027 RepID=UPI00289C0269|nr:hypothetical protein [Sphingobacterium sp.]
MNNISLLDGRKSSLLTLSVAFLLLLTNCKKSSSETAIEEPYVAKNETVIVFPLDAIEDMDTVEQSKGSGDPKLSGPARQQLRKVAAQSEIVSLGGFDAVMTISEDLPAQYQEKKKIISSSTARSSSSTGNKAAGLPIDLAPGTTYRVVLYTADASGKQVTYVGQAEGKVGSTAVSIPANRNTRYRWYAYTNNNTSSIPVFNQAVGTVPLDPTGNSSATRKDFAYATGVITTDNVVDGQNIISGMVLARKTSRIIVEVNSRGMFAPITHANIKFKDNSGVISGNFRLADATLQGVDPLVASKNVWVHHNAAYQVPVDTDTVLDANTKRRYTFYTPTDGTTSRKLVVSIDTLKVTSQRLADADGSIGYVERQFYNRAFEFPTFVAMPGKSYFVSIKLVESAITIGTTKWARGNTWRDANGKITPEGLWQYKMRYDNPLYRTTAGVPTTDYFTSDIYTLGTNGRNICELIYPEGTWDLPTQTQINELSNLLPKYIGIEGNNWYMFIRPSVATEGAPGHPHENLIFAPVGYKTSSTGTTTNFFPNSANYQSTKGYWRTKSASNFAVLSYNTSMVYQSMTSSNLASVRCVRK